jgi:uncharacterized protein YkwD
MDRNAKARLARHAGVTPMVGRWLAALVIGAAFGATPSLAQVTRVAAVDSAFVVAEKGIVERGNALRRDEGRAALMPNAALTAAAREFAQYMARTDQYAHDADGRQPEQRAEAQGYAYCRLAENIAYQFSSAGFSDDELAQRFVQGWMNSPGHRRNLLDAEVTDIGVGLARSARTGRHYAVQVFGRPESMKSAFRFTNAARVAVTYELSGESFVLEPRMTREHVRCTPQPIAVLLPGADQPLRLTPKPGERLRIQDSGGRLRLQRG